ncbi:MAG TPA: methylmalonyl-CoA mutase family protein, partial [Chitinophagaceae bacterium]|nr:methylmalonyl-CoA mutase family protein [Chitinophagaceae bacterium]
GICDTVDPFAGSYYIETLTAELEKEALQLINKIDEMGGSVAAIEQGFIQEQIATSSYRFQQALERKEKIVVGVNKYVSEEDRTIPLLKIDASIEKEQVTRLQAFKAARDMEAVNEALNQIKKAATDGSNLMPPVIEAVEKGCTLGEISHTLRGLWGEYR